MMINYHNVKNLPVIVIDDFYDKIASDKIMQELLYFNNDPRKLLGPEKTGSAERGDKPIKSNRGIFLTDVFTSKEFSNILTESNEKIFNKTLMDILKTQHNFFYYFSFVDFCATLISYYEQNNYYKSHNDKAFITIITWFYKTPKSFSGGDLIIENDLTVECKRNRTVIFPSILNHEVTPIDMNLDHNSSDNNFGRFSITHFLHLGTKT